MRLCVAVLLVTCIACGTNGDAEDTAGKDDEGIDKPPPGLADEWKDLDIKEVPLGGFVDPDCVGAALFCYQKEDESSNAAYKFKNPDRLRYTPAVEDGLADIWWEYKNPDSPDAWKPCTYDYYQIVDVLKNVMSGGVPSGGLQALIPEFQLLLHEKTGYRMSSLWDDDAKQSVPKRKGLSFLDSFADKAQAVVADTRGIWNDLLPQHMETQDGLSLRKLFPLSTPNWCAYAHDGVDDVVSRCCLSGFMGGNLYDPCLMSVPSWQEEELGLGCGPKPKEIKARYCSSTCKYKQLKKGEGEYWVREFDSAKGLKSCAYWVDFHQVHCNAYWFNSAGAMMDFKQRNFDLENGHGCDCSGCRQTWQGGTAVQQDVCEARWQKYKPPPLPPLPSSPPPLPPPPPSPPSPPPPSPNDWWSCEGGYSCLLKLAITVLQEITKTVKDIVETFLDDDEE